MIPPSVPSRVRRARVGVSAVFLINGALIATILPRLPAIKAGLALSNTELGTAVAAMPIGGLLAGGFAGILIHRFGSGRLTVALGVTYAALLFLIGMAPSWPLLAGTFLVLGACDATMDAAMNTHGVAVQRLYGRSILHAFHGWWSAGTIAGGVCGAVAAGIGLPVAVHLGLTGTALAAVTLIASRALLPHHDADATPDGEASEHIGLRNAPRLLRLLGPAALLGVLGIILEDSAQTWSTVYLVEVLGLSAGLAATGFVTYTGAMTVGRLTNDRWVDRWGDAKVARWGALGAAVGLGCVAAAGMTGTAALAFAGFIAVGIGASSMFPAMVTAAGHQPGVPAAHGIALVSWTSRIGLVIAPTAIGIAADAVSLAAAFLLPIIAALLIAALAPLLLGTRAPRREPVIVDLASP